MPLVLKIVVDVLVAMFVVGGIVSAFVIVISVVEDTRDLLSKNE